MNDGNNISFNSGNNICCLKDNSFEGKFAENYQKSKNNQDNQINFNAQTEENENNFSFEEQIDKITDKNNMNLSFHENENKPIYIQQRNSQEENLKKETILNLSFNNEKEEDDKNSKRKNSNLDSNYFIQQQLEQNNISFEYDNSKVDKNIKIQEKNFHFKNKENQIRNSISTVNESFIISQNYNYKQKYILATIKLNLMIFMKLLKEKLKELKQESFNKLKEIKIQKIHKILMVSLMKKVLINSISSLFKIIDFKILLFKMKFLQNLKVFPFFPKKYIIEISNQDKESNENTRLKKNRSNFQSMNLSFANLNINKESSILSSRNISSKSFWEKENRYSNIFFLKSKNNL